MQRVRSRKVLGQIEHPADGKGNLGQTAVVLTDIRMNEANGEIIGTLETVLTTSGKEIAGLIESKIPIGVSSRAEGSLKSLPNGLFEVQNDFLPKAFDVVEDPSTPGAWLSSHLNESFEGMDENKIRLEESTALFDLRINALKEELEEHEYKPYWPSMVESLDENLQDKDNEDYVYVKESVELRKFLYEDADTYASQASQYADDAAAEAENKRPASSHAVEDLEQQAKNASIEAKSALERAKAASTAEEAEQAHSDAADAATAAHDYAEKAKEVSTKGLPEGHHTDSNLVKNTSEDSSVEFIVDFTGFNDQLKRRFNVYRNLEDLSQLQLQVRSKMNECGCVIKDLTATWDNSNMIKIVATVPQKDAERVKHSIKKCFQTDGYNMQENLVEKQARKILQERIQKLEEENKQLKLKLENAETLNYAMLNEFEEQVTAYKINVLLESKPHLRAYKKIFQNCKTDRQLKESVVTIESQIKKSKLQESKNKSNRKGSFKNFEVKSTSYDVDKTALPRLDETLVADGSFEQTPGNQSKINESVSGQEDTFSRMQKYRSRRKNRR